MDLPFEMINGLRRVQQKPLFEIISIYMNGNTRFKMVNLKIIESKTRIVLYTFKTNHSTTVIIIVFVCYNGAYLQCHFQIFSLFIYLIEPHN